MRRLAAALALVTVTLVGCTPVAPLPGVPTGECSIKGLGGLVGRYATPSLTSQARKRAGASVVRVLRPGQVVTMEFLSGRLNVNVDGRNRVRNFTCG